MSLLRQAESAEQSQPDCASRTDVSEAFAFVLVFCSLQCCEVFKVVGSYKAWMYDIFSSLVTHSL